MTDFVSILWSIYKFYKDNNKKIKLDNWELDLFPTEFVLGLANKGLL